MDGSRDSPTKRGASKAPSGDRRSFEQLLHLGELHLCAESFGEALNTFGAARELLGAAVQTDPRGVEVSLRIADSHIFRGDIEEAGRALDQAEVFAGELIPGRTRAQIEGRRGILLGMAGDYPGSFRACHAALDLLRDSETEEDVSLQGRLYLALGSSLHRRGQRDSARAAYEKALGCFRTAGDRRGLSIAYNHLGVNRKLSFEFREAISLLHRALEISDEVGAYGRKAATRLNLGIIHTRLGEWNQARFQLERATQICRELDNPGRLTKALLALGNLHLRCREYGKADEAYREAAEIAKRRGYRRERVLADEFRAELQTTTGRPDRALPVLEAAFAEAEALSSGGDLSCEILRRKADAHLAMNELGPAEEAARRAQGVAEKLGDLTESALAQKVIGTCHVLSGDRERGLSTLEVALKSLTQVEAVFEEAQTHLAIAKALLLITAGSAKQPEIEHHLTAARTRFEQLDVPGYIAEVLLAAGGNSIRMGRLEEAERLLRKAGVYVEASSENPLLEQQLRLKAELDRRSRETLEANDAVSTSRELHRLFREGVDLETAMGELLTLALRRTASDRAILAKGPDTESLTILAARGIEAAKAGGLIRAVRPVIRSSMESGLPTVRAADDWGEEGALGDSAGFVVAPLCLPKDIWGILYLDRGRNHIVGPYRQSDLKIAALLSEVAAISVLAFERKQMMRERDEVLKGSDDGRFTRPILFRSAAMDAILNMVGKVADSPASVLLQGETGTGKGLIARAIHEAGARRDRPFVQVNCAALPESLLESELFGHVSGAFTGAIKTKRGLFEEAEGGTIFLDEVDKTSRAVQAKLLHVLDHREIRPVGANRWKRVDARIVSATNQDLHEVMKRGEFLEDLYYRLNDISIVVPPLRERPEDVELLAQHFGKNFAREMGRHSVELSGELLQVLTVYSWPGNVRELEKTVRRIVVMSDEDEVLGTRHLPPEFVGWGDGGSSNSSSLKDAVQRLERQIISNCLKECRGNKSEASRRLKISYPTLLAKIRAFGLR